MSETWIESELKAALEEAYRPAPWLLSKSMAAARGSTRQKGSPMPWIAGIAAALIAVSSIAVLESIRQHETPNRPQASPVKPSQLPNPIPQSITRTSAGAQIAWVTQSSDVIAVDPNGRVVARLNEQVNSYGIWRSADGATIYGSTATSITAYSALDGKLEGTYSRAPGSIESDVFSPDGRWLALLLVNNDFQVQVIDLQTGSAQELAIPRPANSNTGVLVFAPDSSSLYAMTDWTGPVRLDAFSLTAGKLTRTGSAVSGESRSYPACSAPAVAAKVIAGGKTLVVFCHMDGAVWFFDLPSFTLSDRVETYQKNPFWYSPIFTPDGQLLYLQQWPGFGASVEVIDLAQRKLLGPVTPPTDMGENAPFAWLITNAYAGGVASTVPISPDGLKLYEATSDGVMVLRVPDLKPVARLAAGFNANEVWVSGDGQTIYATSADRKTLLVMRADGSHQHRVNLADYAEGFIASEHG